MNTTPTKLAAVLGIIVYQACVAIAQTAAPDRPNSGSANSSSLAITSGTESPQTTLGNLSSTTVPSTTGHADHGNFDPWRLVVVMMVCSVFVLIGCLGAVTDMRQKRVCCFARPAGGDEEVDSTPGDSEHLPLICTPSPGSHSSEHSGGYGATTHSVLVHVHAEESNESNV